MTVHTMFDRTKAVDADGGDDTLEETRLLDCDAVAIQLDMEGDTSDFEIDVRQADDISWALDWDSLKNKSAPFTEVIRIDAKAIKQIRARVVNQDGTNGGTARLVGVAWD
jgi:hypothetical protein